MENGSINDVLDKQNTSVLRFEVSMNEISGMRYKIEDRYLQDTFTNLTLDIH